MLANIPFPHIRHRLFSAASYAPVEISRARVIPRVAARSSGRFSFPRGNSNLKRKRNRGEVLFVHLGKHPAISLERDISFREILCFVLISLRSPPRKRTSIADGSTRDLSLSLSLSLSFVSEAQSRKSSRRLFSFRAKAGRNNS